MDSFVPDDANTVEAMRTWAQQQWIDRYTPPAADNVPAMPSHIEYQISLTAEAACELSEMPPERREEVEKRLEGLCRAPYHPASKPTGADAHTRRALLDPTTFVEYVISQARVTVVNLHIFETFLVDEQDHWDAEMQASAERIEASGENLADEPDAWQPEKTHERRLTDLEAWAYRVQKLLERLR
jgi:hypothetical protein